MTFKPSARKASSGRRYRPGSIPWTQQEIGNAMVLYDDDHAIEDIAEVLGRSVESVRAKVHTELNKRQVAAGHTRENSKISPDQEAERLARRIGYDARDFTSAVLGDPPRGFSALDRLRSRSLDKS